MTKPTIYKLKPSETNLLTFTQQHQQAIFSGLLSTISLEQLDYKVTAQTQFKLNDSFTEMTLTELPEEKPEEPKAVKTAE